MHKIFLFDTVPLWPFSVTVTVPSFVFHSLTVSSEEPDAINEPSGDILQHHTLVMSKNYYLVYIILTSPSCPEKFLVAFPSFELHNFTVLSLEHDTIEAPSGEKQQHFT